MGYRTTITTNHYPRELPAWFNDKYKELYFISGTLVTSKKEVKHYDDIFIKDLQKALIESEFFKNNSIKFNVVVLGKDGFVTKIIITNDLIEYYWMGPDEGQEAEDIWAGGL